MRLTFTCWGLNLDLTIGSDTDTTDDTPAALVAGAASADLWTPAALDPLDKTDEQGGDRARIGYTR